MNGLEVLIAIAGIGITVLVVVGMVLITPHGVVEVPSEGADAEGSNLSPIAAPAHPPRAPSAT